jgi:hypothetical protein
VINPQEIIDSLINSGALEIDAMDSKTGQMIFKVTDKMIEVAPSLYESISEQIYSDVMSLWQKRLVSLDVMGKNPEVSPTEFGLDRNNWAGLSEGEESVMNTIMRGYEG